MQHGSSLLNQPFKCHGLSDSRWSDPARPTHIVAGVCLRMGRITLVMCGRAVCANHLHQSCFCRTGIYRGKLQRLLQDSILLKKELCGYFCGFVHIRCCVSNLKKSKFGCV